MDDERIEQLYMESLKADVPDYWSKIEAGIKASGASVDNASSDEVTIAKADVNSSGDNVISFDAAKKDIGKKKAAKRNMRPYVGLIAAAVLMVVVVVPVFLAGFEDRRKSDEQSDNTGYSTTTAAMNMEDSISARGDNKEAMETEAAVAEEPAAEAAMESAGEEEMYDDAEYEAAETTEASAALDGTRDYGQGELDYKTNGIAGSTEKIVILKAEVVLKGDKYLFTKIKPDDSKTKLKKEEYEVENPEELVKYMEDFDGAIEVWVCSIHGDKIYVYGPAED
ncbi:MAG: hypothetical protein IKO61_06500 [Lachnospiraceae bacterium]|nr:hypothetical protein [Lachnospiraceae bacterium]